MTWLASFTPTDCSPATLTTPGKGSHGTVGGEMSKAHVGKQYDRGAFSRGEEGLGTGGEMGLVGKGAYEVGKGA